MTIQEAVEEISKANDWDDSNIIVANPGINTMVFDWPKYEAVKLQKYRASDGSMFYVGYSEGRNTIIIREALKVSA